MDNRSVELLITAIMLPFYIIFLLIQGVWNCVIGLYQFARRMVIIWALRLREKEVQRRRTPNYNPFDERYNQHLDREVIEGVDRMEAENKAIKRSLINEIEQEKLRRAIRRLQER